MGSGQRSSPARVFIFLLSGLFCCLGFSVVSFFSSLFGRGRAFFAVWVGACDFFTVWAGGRVIFYCLGGGRVFFAVWAGCRFFFFCVDG